MALFDVMLACVILLFAYLILKPIIKNHYVEKEKERQHRANAEAIALKHAYDALASKQSSEVAMCLRLYDSELPTEMQTLLRERLSEQNTLDDFDHRMSPR